MNPKTSFQDSQLFSAVVFHLWRGVVALATMIATWVLAASPILAWAGWPRFSLAKSPTICRADFLTTPLAEGFTPIQGPHGDTLPSLLLVLCLALALVLLCRSSGRRAESKLEKLDEE